MLRKINYRNIQSRRVSFATLISLLLILSLGFAIPKPGHAIGFSFDETVAANGPILDFDLTQGSGTTVVDSANGVVGTTHGTVWSTDPSGMPVLYFDNPIVYWFGDGDYFEIPYHSALNSPTMSIEALVYPMSTGYYTNFAERIRDGGTWQTITWLGFAATGYHEGRCPKFGLTIGGIAKEVQSPFEIPLNAWSHIVGTYNGNNMQLYVDGVLVATTFNAGGPRDTGSNPLYLGHAPSGNHYFNGFYADFKLYDRALTAEEIAAKFNDPPLADANGPYTINEGDTITLDASGSSDPDNNIALYEWDLDNDGIYEIAGVSAQVGFSDDGLYTVGLKVTDDDGEFDTDTADITVVNVLPIVNAGPDASLNEGDTLTAGGSFADPGTDTWAATVDYGDGAGVLSLALNNDKTFALNHTYVDNGAYTIEVCVSDDGGMGCDAIIVSVANVAPTISSLSTPIGPMQVGIPVETSATFTDPGVLDTHIATWDWGDDTTSEGVVDGYNVNGSHVYGTTGVYTVTLTVQDDDGGLDTSAFQYIVIYDPAGGFVTGGGWIDSPAGAYYPSDLPFFDGSYYEMVWSETPLTWFEARIMATEMTKDNCMSAHLATITSQEEYNKVLELFGEHPGGLLGGFQEEGVYPADIGWQWVTGEPFVFTAWLPGEPNDSPWGVYGDAAEQQLEMYPTGWNDVPGDEPGHTFVIEYEDCYIPTGKATFGFVSKYQKGANVPTGNTEFQFKVADLNFKSTSYDWLVIAGTKAQYKGTGTINGAGEYGFMLTAIDGLPDMFRIKIWDKAAGEVVYDNMLGVEDTADPNTAIQGGSIVIHKAK